jgi:hypothetical protein
MSLNVAKHVIQSIQRLDESYSNSITRYDFFFRDSWESMLVSDVVSEIISNRVGSTILPKLPHRIDSDVSQKISKNNGT